MAILYPSAVGQSFALGDSHESPPPTLLSVFTPAGNAPPPTSLAPLPH